MILTPKAKEYGKRMQDISLKYLNKNAKLFRGTWTQWEEQDVKMIFDDARNLYLIGLYMIEGNFDAAMGLASELDTLVRDEIPNSVWKYLEKFTVDQE
jgi:hypothetical protein